MTDILTRTLRRIGRLAEPVLHPDAVDRRRREATVEKRVGELTASVSRVAEQLERVWNRVDKIDGRQVKHLQEAIATVGWNTRRQAIFADKLLRSSVHSSEHEFVRERILRRIQRIARRDGPVLVGPWTGEVGFELLYWVPFVRWAIESFRIDPARVTLLSRGGTESWYGIEGTRYVDVLEYCSPEEFQRRTLKERKQRTLRLFDRQLMRQAAQRFDQRPSIVHPAMMYALFAPYWNQHTSLHWVHQFAKYGRIRPPVLADQLPPEYVAVRFYFSKCFPRTPENGRLVASLIDSLSAHTHVVLLSAGASLDEHSDIKPERSDRVHTIEHLTRPETNLSVQTAVIGNARAFIGTYGGFSYLAPLCGINTVALYSRRNFYPHHLYLAQQVFEAVAGGSLTVMDTETYPLTRHLPAPV